MSDLKKGDKIKMELGGEATILDEFGSGGQGTVYKVSYEGKEYALKWYHANVFGDKAQRFYENLQNNIEKGAPTDAYLWPLAITKVNNGRFGYIMNIRPKGYYELTDFFVGSKKQKQIKFKSFEAIADAAINIIQSFRLLHKDGYSYQDINNGNFFINPDNGKVLICDNDNVCQYGENLGILGKQRYMAPEIVTMQKEPDKQSDRFSLAVILFRLLFINHPLEGKYSTPPCMTSEYERKYYGEKPIFIYDPNDASNRPIPGTDKNLKTFWPIYPEYLKNLFIEAFSKEVMMLQKPRVLETAWLDVFYRFKACIAKCPHCKEETFIIESGKNTCFECNKSISIFNSIKLNTVSLPLFPKMKIFNWLIDNTLQDISKQVAEVVTNPKNPQLWGLLNTSTMTWKVILVDGSEKYVEPNKVVPINKGYTIEFTNDKNTKGIII